MYGMVALAEETNRVLLTAWELVTLPVLAITAVAILVALVHLMARTCHVRPTFRGPHFVLPGLLLVLVLGSAACGGGGVKLVDDIPLPRGSKAPEVEVPPGPVTQVDQGSQVPVLKPAVADDSAQEAQLVFSTLRNGDVYDRWLAEGICTGMGQLADQPDEVRFSEEGWRAYLYNFPAVYVQDEAKDRVLEYMRLGWWSRVEEATNAWELAQVSPPLARAYLQACTRTP